MTTRTLKERMHDHNKDYNNVNLRSYNYEIYKAMRKYGFKNFVFEELEQCSNEMLAEREQYYIKKFDSHINGYNTALGGKGKPLIDDEEIEIYKVLFESGWMLKDIAKMFDSNYKTVSRKLKEKYGIDTKVNAIDNSSEPILCHTKEKCLKFKSLSDAARYLIENEITNNNNISSIASKICDVLDKPNRTAYGFKWSKEMHNEYSQVV